MNACSEKKECFTCGGLVWNVSVTASYQKNYIDPAGSSVDPPFLSALKLLKTSSSAHSTVQQAASEDTTISFIVDGVACSVSIDVLGSEESSHLCSGAEELDVPARSISASSTEVFSDTLSSHEPQSPVAALAGDQVGSEKSEIQHQINIGGNNTGNINIGCNQSNYDKQYIIYNYSYTNADDMEKLKHLECSIGDLQENLVKLEKLLENVENITSSQHQVLPAKVIPNAVEFLMALHKTILKEDVPHSSSSDREHTLLECHALCDLVITNGRNNKHELADELAMTGISFMKAQLGGDTLKHVLSARLHHLRADANLSMRNFHTAVNLYQEEINILKSTDETHTSERENLMQEAKKLMTLSNKLLEIRELTSFMEEKETGNTLQKRSRRQAKHKKAKSKIENILLAKDELITAGGLILDLVIDEVLRMAKIFSETFLDIPGSKITSLKVIEWCADVCERIQDHELTIKLLDDCSRAADYVGLFEQIEDTLPLLEKICNKVKGTSVNNIAAKAEVECWCLYRIGFCYYWMRKHQQALALVKSIITIMTSAFDADVIKHKVFADCYYLSARANYELKRFDIAAEEFSKAVQLYKTAVDIDDEKRKGKIEGTEQWLRRLLAKLSTSS